MIALSRDYFLYATEHSWSLSFTMVSLQTAARVIISSVPNWSSNVSMAEIDRQGNPVRSVALQMSWTLKLKICASLLWNYIVMRQIIVVL